MKLIDERERRQSDRIDIFWPITIYYNDEEIDGESKNISAEGLYVYCENPLPVNKVLSISIHPPERQSIEAKGKVVWSNLYGVEGNDGEDTYGMGICLVEIDEEDLVRLKDLLI